MTGGDRMTCQHCEIRPATLHYTKIINGEKTEMHLCEQWLENGETSLFQISKVFQSMTY